MAGYLAAFTALLCISTGLSANSLNNILFNGSYEFIDLTYTFDENTVYWPGARNFEFTKKTEESGNNQSWYAYYEFAASEHGGTHLDAPYHFNKSGLHVSELPIEKLIVPCYKCTALVLPMKIAAGTGAPLRLVAICPKECP